MNKYRIKYRCGHSGLIKVFTLEANSAEAAMNIVVSDWGGTVMECEEVVIKTYRIKYRGYYGNTIGYSTVEAESSEDAKRQVSKWGFVLECEKRLVLKESDLANNPPSHPGLQDLDIWTEDQMREWIKSHANMGEFIEGSCP